MTTFKLLIYLYRSQFHGAGFFILKAFFQFFLLDPALLLLWGIGGVALLYIFNPIQQLECIGDCEILKQRITLLVVNPIFLPPTLFLIQSTTQAFGLKQCRDEIYISKIEF